MVSDRIDLSANRLWLWNAQNSVKNWCEPPLTAVCKVHEMTKKQYKTRLTIEYIVKQLAF